MEADALERLMNQMQDWLKQAEEFIRQTPQTQLYTAIGVVLLTAVLLILVRLFKRTKPDTIVLTGLSGGGKTVMFYSPMRGMQHEYHPLNIPVSLIQRSVGIFYMSIQYVDIT
ncbi:unnamed protein product, partial [Thlaspi arvense]